MVERKRKGSDEPKQENEAKQRLVESALHFFSQKGYAGTSIREIIERAGVTRPVLYYYFASKEDLYRRILDARLDEFSQDLESAMAQCSDLDGRLRAMAWTTFQHAERSPEAVRLILHSFFAPRLERPDIDEDRFWNPHFNMVRAVMDQAMGDGQVVGADSETMARAFCGLIDMHVMAKCRKPLFRLTQQLADNLVTLFLQGVLPRESARKRR